MIRPAGSPLVVREPSISGMNAGSSRKHGRGIYAVKYAIVKPIIIENSRIAAAAKNGSKKSELVKINCINDSGRAAVIMLHITSMIINSPTKANSENSRLTRSL